MSRIFIMYSDKDGPPYGKLLISKQVTIATGTKIWS